MRFVHALPIAALVVGCFGSPREQGDGNRWGDERLWAVLEAQEHRDAERLCVLLTDSSAVVREAAALAYASVQDPAGIPCLLTALKDSDVAVRSTAAFALGFVADSAAWSDMADIAAVERDSTVQRALLSATFLAMQRQGRLKDPNAILHYLRSSHGHERARAADALRRLPDSLVQRAESEINALMSEEGAEVRQFLILAIKKFAVRVSRSSLQTMVMEQASPGERVNALRVCGALEGMSEDSFFFDQVGDPVTGQAALEVLAARERLDALECLRRSEQMSDTASRIILLGLVMTHGDEQAGENARKSLRAITPANPYYRAEAFRALSVAWDDGYHTELLSVMQGEAPAVVRQAALKGLVAITQAIMMRSRYASPQDQYRQLANVFQAAINTGDAGLICAVAELLQEEEPETIRILFPPELEAAALRPLRPYRDLEASILLNEVIRKRDGLPAEAAHRPAFNHPIDHTRLRALKQGQRYRIITSKGEIVIATDVDECPGSSVAFDSLVTAGYFNGKAFHRVVPNFVIQGGCPRGDGYGGMPWTLRTEIGRKPFTAGSIGLASAGPDTESCQFFITHSAAPHLDGRYTRFGEVVEGMDVVWRIQVGDRMLRVERAE